MSATKATPATDSAPSAVADAGHWGVDASADKELIRWMTEPVT
jgi:hypothetical protein